MGVSFLVTSYLYSQLVASVQQQSVYLFRPGERSSWGREAHELCPARHPCRGTSEGCVSDCTQTSRIFLILPGRSRRVHSRSTGCEGRTPPVLLDTSCESGRNRHTKGYVWQKHYTFFIIIFFLNKLYIYIIIISFYFKNQNL